MKINLPTSLEPLSERALWRKHSLAGKTLLVSLIVIGTNVVANYALERGLRQIGVVESWSPAPYVRAFVHPWVAIGVIFMFAWLTTRLSLLSWADLTYVLPVTSFSYVISAVIGAVYLDEKVSVLHWLGISVITLGILLVVVTYPKTSGVESGS
jgi:drug/metabolite transporter (DMT)-like permease